MRQSVLILLIILSNACYAQDYCKLNKDKFKITTEDITIFGIAHMTDIDFTDVIPPKSMDEILNIGFGASLKILRIKRTDYIKMEMCYIQKGSSYTFPNQYRENLRLNYFEIPLLWSHCFYFHNHKQYLYFETGLAFSTLFLSSRQISSYVEQSQNPNAPNFKKVDIPSIVTIKVPLILRGDKNLLLGIRLSYSPFSIHNDFKTNGIQYFSYGIQIDYLLNR